MGDPLRSLLGLPEAAGAAANAVSDGAEAFRDEFSKLVKRVDESLRSAAAHAPIDEHRQADGQRENIIAAYQKVVRQFDAEGASAPQRDIDRVMSAAESLGSNAASMANDAEENHRQWTQREGELDQITEKIAELEDGGHEKAPTLRKLIDGIRNHAAMRSFKTAAETLDQVAEKVIAIHDRFVSEQAAAEEASTEPPPTLRTMPGGGGYTYEQHTDGRIFIIDSPKVGRKRIELKRGGKAYEAVLKEIGPFPDPSDNSDGAPAAGEGDASTVLDTLWQAGEDAVERISEAVEDVSDFVRDAAAGFVEGVADFFGDGAEQEESPVDGPAPPEEVVPEEDQTPEILGGAETETEKKLAEFSDAMKNIKVEVGGESIDVRPPYHWNRDVTVTEPVLDPVTGEPELDDKGRPKRQPVIDEKTGEPKKKPHPIKQAALDARKKNPKVAKLLKETFRGENKEFGVGATVGKATPEQMQKFLEESLKEGLIKGLDKEGLTAAQKGKIMKDYLDEYGVSTDCSGLMVQALNFLEEGNMERSANETVPIKSTKGIAGFPKVKKPADLRAGDAMVISGSHVRLITDVDVEKDGVYFTTLESTTGKISKELGSGVRELRWRFPNGEERKNLEILKNGEFKRAGKKEQKYIYTRHETLSEDGE